VRIFGNNCDKCVNISGFSMTRSEDFTSSSVVNRLIERIKSFVDQLPMEQRNIVVAYSGGKDSTLLLHTIVEALDRGLKVNSVHILYNDTLGEIPSIHEWALLTARAAQRELESLGLNAELIITKPEIVSTYYWRVIFRGYPAPNFKFRWCPNLLKIEPTKRALREIAGRHGHLILLTGLRGDESSARSKSIKSRQLGCSLNFGGPNCLGNFILRTDFENTVKFAPMADLREDEVWHVLKDLKTPPWRGGIDYEFLLTNYLMMLYDGVNEVPNCKVRFGCWFCTVSVKHCGLRAAIEVSRIISSSVPKFKQLTPPPRDLELLAKARELLKLISDTETFREPKHSGYSRLGPLKPLARAMIFQILQKVDKMTEGRVLYGLGEYIEFNGSSHQFRELLFERDSRESLYIVQHLDDTPRTKQFDIEYARDQDKILSDVRKLQNGTSNSDGIRKIISEFEVFMNST